MRGTLLGLAILMAAPSVQAEEHPRVWRVEAAVRYVVLGNHHPTGGIAPQLAGGRTWSLSDSVEATAGLEALAFGFGAPSRWMGVLAGPHGRIAWKRAPVRLAVDVGLDVGRIPACNDWPHGALCLRFWGLFPRADVGVSYDVSAGLAAMASFGGRYVSTLAWTGVSWEPSLGARLSW